ncbi:MAG: hypothetical protein KGQ58_09595 [Proteobacteria bacterium]|nr:hypothetical protein [Pseudomonadota bacterium]
MAKWWHGTRTDWWINYLLHFPVSGSVTRYSLEEFCEVASPIIGHKVNKQAKLVELYEAAQVSMGLTIPEESLACQTFKLQLRRYQRH